MLNRRLSITLACSTLLSSMMFVKAKLPPIRVVDIGPASWGLKDLLNRKPATADGIFLVQDHVAEGDKEIWLTKDECRQHYLLLGPSINGMNGIGMQA